MIRGGRTDLLRSLPPPKGTGGSPPYGSPGDGVTSERGDGPRHGLSPDWTALARREGVGPAVIGQAMPGPAPLRSLLEDGPKSAAVEAILLREDPSPAVLEVLKPAA